ncbi:hypothetical protein NQ314_003306 [Rhamnusium bicolor]|uniref:HTH CENPB-type domain-containing protein n=1 Tax=Rhamnusium bicolor TaxID=1586634 RepID=A0AAV8ZQS6_9CUCU|nr:hypothetical protein NQ314_003306 [Rhamnusium bicolor]
MGNKTPIRYAALRFGIKKITLYDRLKKKRSNGEYLSDSGNESNSEPERYSKYGSRQVFSVQEENQLEDYLKVSYNINYGLTFRSCRTLSFEFANELKKKYPSSWDTNRMTGKEWMRLFMRRRPELAYRKPENTSLARAIVFNRHNVDQFF